MPLFDVHVLSVHRDVYRGIEADDQKSAIAMAQEMFAEMKCPVSVMHEHCGHDGDEMHGYLVDVQGDEQYRQTRFYESDGETVAIDERVKLAAPHMLQALKDVEMYIRRGESSRDGFSVLFPPKSNALAAIRAAILKAEGKVQ